jgi:hypothetical protein
MKARHLRLISDHKAFATLPQALQAEVSRRAEWIEKIHTAPRGEKCRMAEAAGISLGLATATIYRLYKNWRSRGWEGLIDGRAAGVCARSLPPAFANYVRQLHLQNQRATTGREVHRQIIERWSAWRRTADPQFAIPGYDAPPAASRTGYPTGWSQDNIHRLRPDAYALATIRQGSKASADFLPSILKTRLGLRYGEVVFFDDQDYDTKIAAPGTSQRALRPQGFNAMDYLSGCFLDYHIRLRWWDTESEKYRSLTQMEFTWFVIAHLQRHGYREDSGTTLVFEHGTASGYNSQELGSFDKALASLSHDKIKVERSGLFNSPAFAGMLFRPQSTGNFKFKAPLESMFNLVRNRMAALPGAVGRNRDLKPAEQYGQDIYTAQLLKAYERLDESHRNLLIYPIMTAQQFGTAAAAVYQAINSRNDHALEGWEECGFVAPQIRFTPDERSPWLSQDELSRLPDSARTAALALAEIPGHLRTIKLSPAHVRDAFAHELTKLPDHAIPLLIPRAWARTAKVKTDRTISLTDQLLGSSAFHYVCRIEARDGAHTINPGTELLCYLNPFMPDRLAVCRMDGSYIGTLNKIERAAFQDQTAILAQLKERSALKADLDSSVRPHVAGLIEDRSAMQRHNARLMDGKPVTPEEIQSARSAAGTQAHRTAAANRLQTHGAPIDWDNYNPEPDEEIRNAWDDLPEDIELPEAL